MTFVNARDIESEGGTGTVDVCAELINGPFATPIIVPVIFLPSTATGKCTVPVNSA